MPSSWRDIVCTICGAAHRTRSTVAETCSPKCRAVLREQRSPTKGREPRVYDEKLVAEIIAMYEAGSSVHEVDVAFKGVKVQLVLERYGAKMHRIRRKGYQRSSRQPFVYDERLATEIVAMYENGSTIRETQAVFKDVNVQTVLKLYGAKMRTSAKRNQSGSANHMWRGNEAGYKALHLRVAALRGKPSSCEWCDAAGYTGRFEWANLTGHYEDVDDYIRLCVPCHRKFDADRRKSTEKHTFLNRKEVV